MRAVIAGGSGLIGRALTAHLTGLGHEVVILSRDPAAVGGLPAGARAERWGSGADAGWHQLLADAALVNLAGENIGEGRWTTTRKSQIRESRLRAGAAIAQAVALAEQKPRVVVQASAIGYYGSRLDDVVTEESPSGADFLARLCVDWEEATAAVEEIGMRRVVIRTGPVLSRSGGPLPRMATPFRLFIGGPLGSGRQWFPWIHIDDEVAAVRFLIEHEEASGPFNLTAPHPLTNAAFSAELGRVLRRPALMRVPSLALSLLFGEMATVLLDGQRAVPRRLLDLGFRFRFPEAAEALQNLLR